MAGTNGGAREGAGRKSKAQEQGLIEKLSPLESIAFEAFENALKENKDWAVKLFFQYNFGMPKQFIDQKNTNINLDENNLSAEERKQVIDELKNAY